MTAIGGGQRTRTRTLVCLRLSLDTGGSHFRICQQKVDLRRRVKIYTPGTLDASRSHVLAPYRYYLQFWHLRHVMHNSARRVFTEEIDRISKTYIMVFFVILT